VDKEKKIQGKNVEREKTSSEREKTLRESRMKPTKQDPGVLFHYPMLTYSRGAPLYYVKTNKGIEGKRLRLL